MTLKKQNNMFKLIYFFRFRKIQKELNRVSKSICMNESTQQCSLKISEVTSSDDKSAEACELAGEENKITPTQGNTRKS